MATYDPRMDAYIDRSADYAKPILEHLRELVHKACPDAEETMKWSMPFFQYHGSILCNMAAFKQHCSFGFWRASLMKDPAKVMQIKDRDAMGHFGHLRSVKDLPADKILLAYIKEAAGLNEIMGKAGAAIRKKAPVRKKSAPKKELPVPALLAAALKKNKKAQATWEAFAPSHRREYNEWITEAKTDETRQKRVDTTIEWITEGKSRHWKYKK